MKYTLRLCTLLLTLVTLCGLTACSTDQAVPEDKAPEQLKGIALVSTVETIQDGSFNSGIWEGVVSFAQEENIPHNYYQPTENSDQARLTAIDQAIQDGAGVVIVPGYVFAPLMSTVPKEYPEVKFIAVDVNPATDMDDDIPPNNLFCISFAEEQCGYLAGYSAVMDGCRSLGFLGGRDIPSVVRFGQGYLQGIDAAATELECQVDVNYGYAGQFIPSPAIVSHMDDWYASGTEIIFACGGGIWSSVVQAATAHEGMVIGVDTDQHHLGEDKQLYPYNPFVTSAMKGLSTATCAVLELTYSGHFNNLGGTSAVLGLKDGNFVGLPTDPESWGFKRFTIDEYRAVRDRIVSGEIVVDNTSAPDFHFPVSSYTNVNYDT